jgi:NADH dehydrogenase
MILVAGGTGRLGTNVVGLLQARGLQVRVLTRDRSRAAHLAERSLDIVEGDIRDLTAVRRAVAGARTVISAIHGFPGTKDANPATIDRDGNHNLIQVAREANVQHFVLISVKDAAPDHPMDLMRMKYAAEQDLMASGLTWTIIRPTSYMETWCEVLGRPLLEKGRTQVFGRGRNPINWVSTADVARFVELAVVDRALDGQSLEIGGPDNLTMTDFVRVFKTESGLDGRTGHIPPMAMRISAIVAGLVNPGMARQIRAGIVMDTAAMAFDASEVRRRYPSVPMTSLRDVVRRDFVRAHDVERKMPGVVTP